MHITAAAEEMMITVLAAQSTVVIEGSSFLALARIGARVS